MVKPTLKQALAAKQARLANNQNSDSDSDTDSEAEREILKVVKAKVQPKPKVAKKTTAAADLKSKIAEVELLKAELEAARKSKTAAEAKPEPAVVPAAVAPAVDNTAILREQMKRQEQDAIIAKLRGSAAYKY